MNKYNDVTSFFYYMWNAWCMQECKIAFANASTNWKHFWDKWLDICGAHGIHGAAERFYAELSHSNRELLVRRAVEVYDGDEMKKPDRT